MPKIRSVTIVSAALCVSAAAANFAIETGALNWSVPDDLLDVIALLAGFLAVVTHYSKVSTDRLHATAEELRESVAETTENFRHAITEEHKILHRSIIAEIESYGEQRTIDTLIAAERRRVDERQSGQETIDLYSAELGPRKRTNVTPLLRNRG